MSANDHIDRRTSKLLDLWPLWLTVLGGIAACFKFYYTVNDLSMAQKSWQATTESRRDKNKEEFESIRTRITKIETDIEWMKGRHR